MSRRACLARLSTVALAALGWLLPFSDLAAADGSRTGAATGGGTLSISPAIIDTVAGPDGQLPSITVANGTTVRFRIRVYPALVDQMLEGGLTIRDGRAALRAAARRFALTPHVLLLAPGETATVQARLLLAAPRGEAVAAAVVEAIPAAVRRGRVPPYRLRLLGALLIPGVHAPAAKGRIESITVEQAGPGRLRFRVRERNLGKVHSYPRLRVRVFDRSGRVVLSAEPRNGVVLPRYTREVTLETNKRLPPGRSRGEASGTFGSVRSRAVVRFTLTAANRLGSG